MEAAEREPALPEPDVCAVCLTDPSERAVLDSCAHVFCVPCLSRWATIETKCPLCKSRFTKMTPTSATGAQIRDAVEFRETNQGDKTEAEDEVASSSEDEAERYFCDVCRRGDDEECLLLCDACDVGAHTFCVGLERVPNGRWYCEICRGEGRFGRTQEAPMSSSRRRRSESRSRARDILLHIDGGREAVRMRERRMERERRAGRERRRGHVRRRGGGGERTEMRSQSGGGDDERVRQISRVHELREAWSRLQSGQMEFPGWRRESTRHERPRITVPSAPRPMAAPEPERPKGVVDAAWDTLQRAMESEEKKSKKRAGKEPLHTDAVGPSTSSPRKIPKRPSVQSERPGWSMSASAWAPRESAQVIPRVDTASKTPVVARPRSPEKSHSSGPSAVSNSAKFAAAERVKSVLRPMWAAGDIASKEQYKDIARRATSEVVALDTTDEIVVANIVNRLRGGA